MQTSFRSLLFLAALLVTFALPVRAQAIDMAKCELREGGIFRGPKDKQALALVFTGHGFAEGGAAILDALAAHQAKGSFFLTGGFLTNRAFSPLVKRMLRDGHFVGPHSDQHLLYCSWEAGHKTLLSSNAFQADLVANLQKLRAYGVDPASVRYFLPAFEHYNHQIAGWARAQGLTLVNFTPGTRSNADYTGEADKNFVSAKAIFDSILAKEKQDPNGLNGFILLLHLGAGPERTDKFHYRFSELLEALAARGYRFVRIDELLEGK